MNEEIILNVRKRSTLKFIFFSIITLGYYSYVWLWKLINDLNKLDFEQTSKLSFWKLMTIPIILDIYDIYNTIITWNDDTFSNWDTFYMLISGIIYLIISIIILKKIENFSQQKYNMTIKYNKFGIIFFSFLYVNFVINDFSKRAKNIKLNTSQQINKEDSAIAQNNSDIEPINSFLFSKKGRLDRINFFYNKLALISIFIIAIFFNTIGKHYGNEYFQYSSYIIKLVFWIGCIFAASKRLRDICWSQWYLLCWFIPLPFIAIIADIPLFFIKSKKYS